MKKNLNENICLKCEYYVQFYVAQKVGHVYAVGYAYCDKYHMVIHNPQKECDKFKKGKQLFRHAKNIECFYELDKLKKKFRELKDFLNKNNFN